MAFFRFCRASQTCHVVIQRPKPQPSCPPTICGGAAFWLVLPFLCLGKMCRGRKAGHKVGNCCGMCKVPNKPNLGAKPSALHWALQGPMMPCHALVAKWVGGLHVWGLSLPRVGRLGVANVGLLQAWSAKVPKMAHCRPKTANRWLEVPDWSIVFQKQTQKNAVWQATATVASAAEKRANLGQPGPKPVSCGCAG